MTCFVFEVKKMRAEISVPDHYCIAPETVWSSSYDLFCVLSLIAKEPRSLIQCVLDSVGPWILDSVSPWVLDSEDLCRGDVLPLLQPWDYEIRVHRPQNTPLSTKEGLR